MIKIEYDLTSYEDLIRHIAKCLKLKITDNTIRLTEETGSGTVRFYRIQDELQLLVYDYIPATSIMYHRRQSKKEFFVIRLDIAKLQDGQTRNTVFLSKTTQQWFYLANAGNELKHVNILFSQDWLNDYLKNENAGDVLVNYLNFKDPLMVYDNMNAEFKKLMLEIITEREDKSIENMVRQNRVMLLLEKFFTGLFTKIENEKTGIKIPHEEVERMKQVEALLLKDVSDKPPIIADLSKVAAMSPSKLKNIFKEVYGMPINQYYQKHRMNRAKAMLLTKKYSLREIADAVGFESVSAFTKVYRKVFNETPVIAAEETAREEP